MTDGEISRIYVALLDEGIEVFREVLAQRLSEDQYRIVEQPYDQQVESWESVPGDVVRP